MSTFPFDNENTNPSFVAFLLTLIPSPVIFKVSPSFLSTLDVVVVSPTVFASNVNPAFVNACKSLTVAALFNPYVCAANPLTTACASPTDIGLA